MRGEPAPDAPQISAPPTIFLEANAAEDDKLRVTLVTQSATSPRTVRLFVDGQIIFEVRIFEESASPEILLDWPPQARILSAVARDDNGLLSSVASKVLPLKAGLGGRLVGLAVGVDDFQDPTFNLHYAASDVERIKVALKENKSGYYGEVLIDSLLNDGARSEKIISKLEEKVTSTTVSDTFLFFFSGHGVKDKDGELYLAASGTSLEDLSGTGLAWARVASVLKKSKSRVIVILDACHAGLSAMTGQVATNDQIASELSSVDVPIVVLAAAKGRQRAYEDSAAKPPRWGGGVFTSAIVHLLGPGRVSADSNHDGVLEVSEFYRALKEIVATETKGGVSGVQTPWIERRNHVGDYAIF
jgi:hypothetical protein